MKGLKKRLIAWGVVWEDYPWWEVGLCMGAACALLCFFGYLMMGLDIPKPPLDLVTQVEVISTEHGKSRVYEDEFGITKCYAHLNFNTQYKLWFPEEEERPLTIIVTPESGEKFTVYIGEKSISFGGKSFPLKQGEDGESLDTLTEHLLLKES